MVVFSSSIPLLFMFNSTFLSWNNKLSSYWLFARSYWNSYSGYNFEHSTYFIKYSTWFNNRYPIFRGSLPRPHTYFCRSYYNRFVGKYMHPYFSIMRCISCHCSSPGFYLSSCDPSGFKCLKSVSVETNLIALTRYSLHSSSMLLMKSGSFGVIVDGFFLINPTSTTELDMKVSSHPAPHK